MSDIILRRSHRWSVLIMIAVLHGAAFTLCPFFFSWHGLAAFGVLLVLTGLGVTLGYHRLLTHRSFATYTPVRWLLAILGLLSGQGPPIGWAADHRRHHEYADKPGDPHSPTIDGFLFAHMSWLWSYDRKRFPGFFAHYAPDLCRDRFMCFLSRSYLWWHLAAAALVWLVGYLVGGMYIAMSMVTFGVLLRIVVVLHSTWLVNSASHLFGYRRYCTADNSRNNWVIALLTFGEGWHNNHHQYPTAANHGFHCWWEIDVTYLVLLLLRCLGLAWNIRRSSPHA